MDDEYGRLTFPDESWAKDFQEQLEEMMRKMEKAEEPKRLPMTIPSYLALHGRVTEEEARKMIRSGLVYISEGERAAPDSEDLTYPPDYLEEGVYVRIG